MAGPIASGYIGGKEWREEKEQRLLNGLTREKPRRDIDKRTTQIGCGRD